MSAVGGCVIGAKRQSRRGHAARTAAGPAPRRRRAAVPPPLSIPQTQVRACRRRSPSIRRRWPPPQPAEAPAEPPSTARPRARRRRSGSAAGRPPEAAAPAAAAVAAPEPERPPIQEILPAETAEAAAGIGAEPISGMVGPVAATGPVAAADRQQGGLVKRIEQFVKLSDDAERSGNMREADEFAERALVLARELDSAR